MPNALAVNGGQPQKPTRFSNLYTGRWSSGIWTNRSPLRDANTTRIAEKYYGPSGDALIAGSNVEVTNRLTLARRPGNPVFDDNDWSDVDNFYSFRLFGPNDEQIKVMVDQANALYSLFGGVKTLVWEKSEGAGETIMQSVGNSLYFGNGVDNKKWLQSLFTWTANTVLGTGTTPFLQTFFVDENGNIQQLTGAVFGVTNVQVATNVLTINSSDELDTMLTQGAEIVFPSGMAASFLDGQTVTVDTVGANSFTATFDHSDYGPTAETGISASVLQGGTPTTGSTEPVWSTTVPDSGNDFQGGITIDGTAQWTNRGLPTENWGIVAPTKAPDVTIGSSRSAWQKNTFFSLAGVVIDSNGNLQQVTTAGLSGATEPTWAIVVGDTTTDNGVVWTMIQDAASLVWQPHTHYDNGAFVVGNAGGTDYLFQLASGTTITVDGTVNIALWSVPAGSQGGQFIKTFPATGPDATDTNNSFVFNPDPTNLAPMHKITLNGAGEITASTAMPATATSHFNMAVSGAINVPVAGQYTLSIKHQNGFYWGIGDSAGNFPVKISGLNNNPVGQTTTAVNNYPSLGGNNVRGDNGPFGPVTDSYVINFPVAGSYPVEIDFGVDRGDFMTLYMLANNANICPTPDESGATEPIWPVFSTGFAPNYPSVKEAQNQYVWRNLGPTTDDVWAANINFTEPDRIIIDSNGNNEGPYRAGVTGTTEPTWAASLNQLTTDNPNLIWINQGPASAPPPGTISAFNGGFKYAIALVNTLDDTVSNCSPLSSPTGNFVGADGVEISGGLDPNKIDPQADYVAIFRTTDGGAIPFLIPGTGNSFYTVSLAEYLENGYTDTASDEELNNEIEGAIAGENTPPLPGATNLTYYLNRIFFSIGNIVYWTSGPDTPVGNGVNGVAPLNFNEFPSLIKRIVPTAIGALVFTVSDIWIIQGQGTANSPIQTGQTYLQGIGILSWNALEVNGSIIGFYTTDKQFLILDPSAGLSYSGFPIGDQFRQNNGEPGTNWNPSNVYVTWHADGEDEAWYVGDGEFGWFRLMATPAPESGYTWSPFATIVGGVQALKSIEVSPGVHKLLLGPVASGGSGGTGISLVQSVGGFPTDADIVVPSVSSSNKLIAFLSCQAFDAATPSISDDKGNTYELLASDVTSSDAQINFWIYLVSAPANGTTTVSASVSGTSVGGVTLHVAEVSGLVDDPGDTFNFTRYQGTLPTSPDSGNTGTLASPTEIVFGLFPYVNSESGNTVTTGAGYTQASLALQGTTTCLLEYKIVDSTDPVNATASATSAAGRAMALVMTFIGSDAPPAGAPILMRDLDTSTDNGTAYEANAVIGSIVLAEPGQLADVSFITTDCVNVGKPLFIGVIMDEALPYFDGPFEALTNWVNDPPNFPKSKSILGQRFYFSEIVNQAAACRHMQIEVDFGTQDAPSELLALTLFGAYAQEL